MSDIQTLAIPEEQWRELLAQLSDLALLIEATMRVDLKGNRSRRLSTLKEVMSAAGITPDIPDEQIDIEGSHEVSDGFVYIPISFLRHPGENAADWFERYACDVIQLLFRHLSRCHPGLIDQVGHQVD